MRRAFRLKSTSSIWLPAKPSWNPPVARQTSRRANRKVEGSQGTGGFHEGFAGSQMEDVDFSLKARLKGFSCRYLGDVAVLHLNQERNARMGPNLALLLARWRDYPHLLL